MPPWHDNPKPFAARRISDGSGDEIKAPERRKATPGHYRGFCCIGENMTPVFRIPNGPSVGDILDSVEALQAFARDHGPSLHEVDERSLNPFPETTVSAIISWPHLRGDHLCPISLGSARRKRIGIACSSSIKNAGISAWIA